MNTPPPFEYPAADAREFFVPCDATDEQREQFWCRPCNGFAGCWYDKDSGAHYGPADSCGQHWRKKVAVPDGWEICPLKETPGEDCQSYVIGGNRWHSDSATLRTAEGFQVLGPCVFIRRIPATVQPAPKADELPDDFWNKKILGRADFYGIAKAYQITDPRIAHALKKLLRCGRTHKSIAQDVTEAIETLKGWNE